MFSNQLRYLRLSRELNQVQLAEKLGVAKQSVSNWENGNIMPSVEMLEKIADFFDVSTDYLLGRFQKTSNNRYIIDATGLNSQQLKHIQLLIEDLRNG